MSVASPESDSAEPKPGRPPRALALFDFARSRGELHGHVALSSLDRLRDLLSGEAGPPVQWSLVGFERERTGLRPQAMVTLRVQAQLHLACQRCLQDMVQAIDETVQFRLVMGEPPLTQEELEAEDEALPAQDPVDLCELIEDQLILAMPLVPMHTTCPHAAAPAEAKDQPQRQQPFAHLRTLIDQGKVR
ncbi:MAG: YceD family protein [Thiomonas sp.]